MQATEYVIVVLVLHYLITPFFCVPPLDLIRNCQMLTDIPGTASDCSHYHLQLHQRAHVEYNACTILANSLYIH